MNSAIAKLGALKSTIGAGAFLLATIATLIASFKIPAKLDATVLRLDEHMQQMNETNRELRTLVCLQARLHTTAQCLVDTK